MPTVFFSYCHADEKLRDQLEVQLSMLKRQGVIETWHDRRIGAGQDFANEIDDHVNSDEIVLLLVSPDFRFRAENSTPGCGVGKPPCRPRKCRSRFRVSWSWACVAKRARR